MSDDAPRPVRDPVSPEHKRFVLTQASLRLWIMLAAIVALAIFVFVEF